VVPAPQEVDDLPVLLAGEIRLVAHMGDGHVIVAEGSLAQWASVVARTAIELEEPAPRRAVVVGRVVRPRRVDGDVPTQSVAATERPARRRTRGRASGPAMDRTNNWHRWCSGYGPAACGRNSARGPRS